MGPIPALSDPIAVLDRASVSVVRERVRQAAELLGMPVHEAERCVIGASELAQNQVDYAGSGSISVSLIDRDGVPGIELIASDSGPGIAQPWGAFAGSAPSHGLGSGLPAVRRLCQEVDLDVRRGEGTEVRARRFQSEPAWTPSVAVLGRPYPGEPRSGDHAVLVRSGGTVLVAVIDGVGHGPEAREAADLAAREVRRRAAEPLPDLLGHLHEALRGSRGVAITFARWASGQITLAGVGNVAAMILGPRGEQRYQPTAGVLGARQPPSRAPKSMALPRGSLLILATDGISSRAAPERRVTLKGPVAVAQHLVEHHAKDHDDALVAVLG